MTLREQEILNEQINIKDEQISTRNYVSASSDRMRSLGVIFNQKTANSAAMTVSLNLSGFNTPRNTIEAWGTSTSAGHVFSIEGSRDNSNWRQKGTLTVDSGTSTYTNAYPYVRVSCYNKVHDIEAEILASR